ncbi:two-component regulator propeller domain-containing protein [Labilibaculum antarcticum]|nr:two-component regulator propeller domain-containing protein [Labilibaculum antarcticum]
MKKTLLLLLLGFINLFSISAQDKWINLDYATTNTGDNGLIGSWVQVIFEDSKNNLWIGTESGISIKKGGEWSSLTEKDGLVVNEVGDIEEDRNGLIWLATNESILKYDGVDFISWIFSL